MQPSQYENYLLDYVFAYHLVCLDIVCGILRDAVRKKVLKWRAVCAILMIFCLFSSVINDKIIILTVYFWKKNKKDDLGENAGILPIR